jgi:SHS2 domain-containing protein
VWLSELLYNFHTEKILFNEFKIKTINENHVYAEVSGENIDKTNRRLKREIKAVTYHGMKINHANGKWTAEIIFDL